ncbi:MAG TPA: JAB domain-containing protein, partial [Thiolinea sp.]|nr:JAB domain-containing protein [Thiolinea sp.]
MGNFRQWLETGSSGMFSADPERDDGSRLTREFKRSYANLLDTGKAALGAVTGSEALQLSAELDQQATAARYAQPDDVQSVTDIGSLSDFGDWLAGAAGQAAGSASQMVLGGGVGGMAVKGLAREAGKRALAAGVAAGSTATSYPQQLGENVLAMREENNGTLPDGALGKAAGIAALQSGLDVMPFLSVARKLGIGDTVAREVGSRAATRLGLLGREMGGVALKEGGTEAAQEALKIAGLEWVNDNKDRLTRDNFIELVDAAALGAVGGGMMGSVSGLNLARQAKDKPWMQSLTAAKQAAVDAYAETGDRGQLEAAAATLQQQKQAYQVADAEADLQAALAAANPPSASAGRVMRQPDQVAASASIPRQRGADWLPDPDAGLYDAGRTDARPISLASRARRTSELERGLNPDAGLYDAGEWDGYLLPLPPATAAATAAGPAAASGSRLRPVFEPDGYDQRSEQRIAGLEQASTEAEIDRIMADNGSDPERYPDLHDRVERIARERKRELLKQELADLRREREKYGEVSDAVLKPPAPVQAQPASADTAPATPGPGAGELLEVATTNGRRIKVRRKELEGEQETLRVFHLNGKRKTRGLGQRIHRQNIEGQPGALLSESVVSGRDLAGKGFSVVKNPKTQEAENRLLLDGYLPIEKNGNGYQVGLLGAWAKPEGAGVEWAGRMRALKPGRPFAFEELLRGEQAIQDSAPADGHPHPPAPSRLDELAIDSEGVTPAERTKDGGTPAVTDATSPLPIQTDSPVDSSGVETGQVAQQKRKVAEKKRKSGHAVNESQTEYAVGGDVYPEISHDRYVSIHAPRGEFGRGFDPSKSVYLPEGSGFNPEDADEAGRTLAGRVRSDGRDRLKAKAAVLKGNSRHLPGIFATITRLVPHKKYRIGVNRIRDHYDAAHVFQVLHGNRARETLDVLVLDRRGKILAAQRMSTGTVDASSVYPGDIVRFVASIPGADHFYTGHNHPSGNPVFSEADHGMTGRISDYAERLPFRFAGMFAIGADEF